MKTNQYKIKRSGFEDICYTESSKEELNLPDAVKFAADRNSVLQSVREAAAFRIEKGKTGHSQNRQATRTTILHFYDDNPRNRGDLMDLEMFIAIDDSPDARRNIILSRSKEGFDHYKNGKAWTLPLTDPHIRQILKRAEKNGRIIRAPNEDYNAFLPDEFGYSGFSKALLGDVAAPLGAYTHKSFFNKPGPGIDSHMKLELMLAVRLTLPDLADEYKRHLITDGKGDGIDGYILTSWPYIRNIFESPIKGHAAVSPVFLGGYGEDRCGPVLIDARTTHDTTGYARGICSAKEFK